MNIDANEVADIKNFLQEKLNAGSRWVAYERDKGSVAAADLHVFASCNDAQRFCDKSSSGDYQFHYTPLEGFCDALNGTKASTYSYDEILEAWNRHAIEEGFGAANISTIEKLCMGELVPFSYLKDFLPRDEIGKYEVVEVDRFGSGFQSHKIIQISLDFEKAKQFYDDEVSASEKDPLRHDHQFLLIGQFKNQSIEMDYDTMQRNNKGLLLKMASPIQDQFGHVKHRDYKTFYEFDEPTFSIHSMFVKYNEHGRDLAFYNHKLEEVDPMKLWSHISVACYDGAPRVTIIGEALQQNQRQASDDNAPTKNIGNEMKEQVKESRVYVQTPKNRFY